MPPERWSGMASALSASWNSSNPSMARSLATSERRLKNLPYETRFCITLRSGSRLSACETIPKSIFTSRCCLRTSMSKTLNVPDDTGETHEIILIVEVLPAPLGPRKPKHSPR